MQRKLLTLLFITFCSVILHGKNSDEISTLPSEETINEIHSTNPNQRVRSTRDWWEEGPPTEGGGGGGAIGIPIGNGVIPTICIGLIYILCTIVIKRRKINMTY